MNLSWGGMQYWAISASSRCECRAHFSAVGDVLLDVTNGDEPVANHRPKEHLIRRILHVVVSVSRQHMLTVFWVRQKQAIFVENANLPNFLHRFGNPLDMRLSRIHPVGELSFVYGMANDLRRERLGLYREHWGDGAEIGDATQLERLGGIVRQRASSEPECDRQLVLRDFDTQPIHRL